MFIRRDFRVIPINAVRNPLSILSFAIKSEEWGKVNEKSRLYLYIVDDIDHWGANQNHRLASEILNFSRGAEFQVFS
jgi:hypothetical protein